MNALATVDRSDGFELFPWSPNFETGISLIDQQHQKLVMLLNRLAEQHVKGVSEQAIEQIVGELADYADYHFKTEDEIWGRYLGDDAWVSGHAQMHAAFFDTVKGVRSGNRSRGAVLEDLFAFLTRWLAHHILDSDKRMARAVLAVQAGCTVEVAKQRADEDMSSGTELLVHTALSMYQRLSAQALELMREKHARLCAESALTISEERWKFLLEDAGEGVWEWDDAGFCTDLEGGVPEIRLLEQLAEGDWRVYGDDVQRVRANFIAHLAGVEDSLVCQYRIVSPGGAFRWMRMRGRVIQRDGEGRALRMIGARQDVTERELARQIVAHGHEVLFITDADNCIIAANPAFSRLTGYALEEVLGRAPQILKSERHSEAFFAHMWAQLQASGCWEGEIWNRRKNGADLALFMSIHSTQTPDGSIGQYVAIGYDITAYKAAQAQLQRLLDAVQAGTWEWNIRTGELRLNEHWAGIIGYRLDELAPVTIATWERLVHPEDLRLSAHLLAEHFSGQLERYECEVRMLHKNGEWRWVRTLGRVVSWSGGREPGWMAGIHLDVTEQKDHQQQLDFVVNHDVLTRLPNRTLLTDRLEVAMAECRRAGTKLAVAYIDLDGFARINETHGRAAGDRLLVTLTGRIRDCLRETNGLARIGGDEFAVLLTAIDHRDECVPPVLRLLEVISLPLSLDIGVVYLSASIGVALFEEGTKADAEQLLRQADQAMYQAKLAGKNRYHFFDPEHDQTVRGHLGTIDEIRHALANHEFVLHYQPKVNMRSGALIGLEALIRWQHPQRGLLPPAMFIPLLEGHAMSIALGDWVIETALAQLAEWKRGGFETSVSVNISGAQLQDPDFFARLERQMRAQPLVAPRQLELEILETGALEDMDHVEQLVARCRAIDVRFALDDFGTGYSSLTYLKRLAAATIKIDQSFVRGMLADIEHVAIINSVLGLAHTFDRQPLAEGVESEEHGEMLLQLGCELGQGFGIARPMPADAVPAWRDDWRSPAAWCQSRTLDPDEMSVLMAEVEHRGWHQTLQAFLRGECKQPPPLGSNSCRFDRWLRTAVRHERFAGKPVLNRLGELHERVHGVGTRIVSLIDAGEHETLALEGETLARYSRELVESLRDLRKVR
jgi:diguanylate cyclase (GGDEF)-like protein/hemerythrin-like metal-binding protein/PAS domain S-box-containing protein